MRRLSGLGPVQPHIELNILFNRNAKQDICRQHFLLFTALSSGWLVFRNISCVSVLDECSVYHAVTRRPSILVWKHYSKSFQTCMELRRLASTKWKWRNRDPPFSQIQWYPSVAFLILIEAPLQRRSGRSKLSPWLLKGLEMNSYHIPYRL